MKDIDAAIAKLQSKYIAAVCSRNVSGLIQLYDAEARVFDAWGIWEYQGTGAWQIAIEGWLSSNPGNQFRVSFSDTQVIGRVDMASMTAIVSYAIVAPDGNELHSMLNRITWIVRTTGHNLRIVHEHTSAPIGFEDMKAILKR